MSPSRHSAAGPAAGYLYQCERALLELAQRAALQSGLMLFLEKLDDVHLEEHGHAVDVLQIKHHAGGGGSLSDESQDLWRTLAVWIDVLPALDHDEQPEFTLLTTSRATDGAAARRLRSDDLRDPGFALRRLREVATGSSLATTAAARERFAALDPADQERLVSASPARAGRRPGPDGA